MHTNVLHYGDNLLVLRESIASESVDLIYLRGGGGDKRGKEDGRADPTFSSKREYGVFLDGTKERRAFSPIC